TTNETQFAMVAGGIKGLVQAGKMTALAVTSASRVSIYPEVPTVKEASGIDYVEASYFGYYTTQGTPTPVADKLTRAIIEIMSTEANKDLIRKQGFDPDIQSADQWLEKTLAYVRRAKAIAVAVGVTPQ